VVKVWDVVVVIGDAVGGCVAPSLVGAEVAETGGNVVGRTAGECVVGPTGNAVGLGEVGDKVTEETTWLAQMAQLTKITENIVEPPVWKGAI